MRDATTSGRTAPLVTLLAIGVMLNGFMSTPNMLQLAFGRTKFIVALNGFYVLVFVPVIYFGVSAYGAIAAGYAWIAINASGIVLVGPLMHRNALPEEKWRWYVHDVALPAGAAFSAAYLVYLVAPAPVMDDMWTTVIVVASAILLAFAAAVSVSPVGRRLLDQGRSRLAKSSA
jgi:O-antigen/teichoic acid export membrane protein